MAIPKSLAPAVFAHSTQPSWGHAVVAEIGSDRTRYVFENAGERTFVHGAAALVEVTLPQDERDALAKRLLGRARPSAAGARKKATKSRPRARTTATAAAAAPATTTET